jgi:hypothetical protein
VLITFTLEVKMPARVLWIVALLMSLFAACTPAPDVDVRGTWEYTLTASDGNVYDLGRITFSGSPAKGTYAQVNLYDVVYEGEWVVSGSEIKVQLAENWQGKIVDANTMRGEWSRADGVSGTFVATRVE